MEPSNSPLLQRALLLEVDLDAWPLRGTVQDVTMERQAEEAFRRGERRFRALTKNAPVGIVELDTDGRCVFVNGRFCELSGIPPEKTAGWGWMGALHPDERDIVAGRRPPGREGRRGAGARAPHDPE